MKNIFTAFGLLLLFSCGETPPAKQKVTVSGYAQGTTYSITYISGDGKNYQRAIDSTLIEIDNSLSTYQKKSIISNFNKDIEGMLIEDELFVNVFNISKIVYTETDSLFDPTVAPLVNAWGFGFENIEKVNESVIDSLMQYVGFNKLSLGFEGNYKKASPYIQLDFNAVAQGYTVDVLGGVLEERGINNYLVEVGGELKAKGVNMQDTLWRIGIDKPLPDMQEREIEAIVHLKNKALATSGNYRKFYEKEGKKYSHTINPKTGYPVEHNLLSATVITDECAYADAYATAFMVMGLEKSKEFLKQHKELDALLIYSNEKGDLQTFVTENFKQFTQLNSNKK